MKTSAPASFATITLSNPIKRGESEIAEIKLRQPRAGELRGLNLLDVGQLKVDALISLTPRISDPILTEPEVAALEVADLMAIGVEVANFLLPNASLSSST